MKHTIIFFLGLLLAGCAGLTVAGRNVKVFDGTPAFDCVFAGEYQSSESMGLTRDQDLDSAVNQVKNYAGQNGANWVTLMRRDWGNKAIAGGVEVKGQIFKCSDENFRNKNECEAGNAGSCNNYSSAAFNSKKFEIGYKYQEKACQLGHSLSCTKIKEDETAAQVIKGNCEKGKGDACGEYAQFVGIRGDTILAKTYLRKGCRNKSEKACDFLDYIEEHEKKARQNQESAFQDRALQIQAAGVQAQHEQVQLQKNQMMLQAVQQNLNNMQAPVSGSATKKTETTCETVHEKDHTGKINGYRTVCH